MLTDKQIVLLRPDKHVLGELLVNTPLLCAVVWTVVKPQADKLPCPECAEAERKDCEYCKGIGRLSELSFVDSLGPDAIISLRKAFWESLCRFFPEQKTALLILLRQYEASLLEVAKSLEEMEAEIEKQIAASIAEQLKDLPATLQRRLSGESVSE